MAEKESKEGLTRRNFIRTVGLGGIAATGIEIDRAMAAPAQAAGQAQTVPKRKLGKTGVEVSDSLFGRDV